MTAQVLPLYPKETAPPKCSFCGKTKNLVKKMLSNGQDKFICDVCIQKAKELINVTYNS